MTLYQQVSEAYENAIFNGYNLELLTAEEVALDMCQYDAVIEGYDVETVKECVIRYRSEKNK